MKLFYQALISFFALAVSASPLFAQESLPSIPEALIPWISWVEEQKPERHCAVVGSGVQCSWPGHLTVSVQDTSATFELHVEIDKASEVQLPGARGSWPLEVEVRANAGREIMPARVIDRAGSPVVFLNAGAYEIRGSFAWTQMPESLAVPPGAALVALQVKGNAITQPKINSSGQMWLAVRDEAPRAEEDALTIEVQRMVRDEQPFRITTRLNLTASGKVREITVGDVALAGSETVDVQSALPFRIAADRTLSLQVRPGNHVIELTSLMQPAPKELRIKRGALSDWPTEEIWVWLPHEELRTVEVSGVQSIDPSRTRLSGDWIGNATYLMQDKDTFTLNEVRRGEETGARSSLQLARTFWLDLDGSAFTVRDRVSGSLRDQWRIDMQPGTDLGRVAVNGADQLITKNPASGLSGVEVRSENLSLEGDSRLAYSREGLPAVSWDRDVDSLSMMLNLPPGWTLLGALGADRVPGGWVEQWSLLDLFLLLLISIATARVIHRGVGLGVAFLLVLSHNQFGSPYLVFFHLAAAVALLRVIPAGLVRRFISIYFYIALFFLLIITLRFSIVQVQSGLFPQLASDEVLFSSGGGFQLIESVLGFLSSVVMLGGMGVFVVCVFKRQWRNAFVTVAAMIVFFIALPLFQSINSSRFNSIQTSMNSLPAPQSGAESAVMSSSEEFNAGDSAGEYREQGTRRIRTTMSKAKVNRSQSLQAQDPKAQLTTGPGVPNWSWRQWSIMWDGSVTKDATVRLVLLSPFFSLCLSFLRTVVALVLLLAYVKVVKQPFMRALPAVAVLCIALILPLHNASAQEFPSTELLKQLEQRIDRDRCTKDCAAINDLAVQVVGGQIQFVLKVASRGNSAVALPGPIEMLNTDSVRLNGQKTSALRRDDRGFLWVRLPDGVHEIEFSGAIQQRKKVLIQFALTPRHVSVNARGWLVDGVTQQGLVENSIELISEARDPVADSQEVKDESEVTLPEWIMIERELTLNLPWQSVTTVRRLGSAKQSYIAKVPLLVGESVISGDVKVEEGFATLNFARGVRELQYQGSLLEQDSISLEASTGGNQSERWVLQCSGIFRCQQSGLTPNSTISNGQAALTWTPWPGERAVIAVTRPVGVGGETATIDSVILKHTSGERLMNQELQLSIRSSQGGFQNIRLPESSELQEVMQNGAAARVQPREGQLALPLTPGVNKYSVRWTQPHQSRFVERLSAPQIIGRASANIQVEVAVPAQRWVLWASGPSWGPVFTYWGFLLLIGLAAFIIARARVTDLGFVSWCLLGLGLSVLPVVAMIVPPLWFAAITQRRRAQGAPLHLFNLGQVAFVILTVLTLAVFAAIVTIGLTGSPDMAVMGYGSSESVLRWYQDRTTGELPVVTIFSLPLWTWRIFMFIWSGWLAVSVLKWLKAAWTAFSEGGFWRRSPVGGEAAVK